MLLQLSIGGMLIILTVFIHAIGMDFILGKVPFLERIFHSKKSIWKALVLTSVVLLVTCVLIVEIWIWALFYFYVNAFPDIETALFFSIDAFSTVGFGDVIVPKQWRLLGSIEAVSGFLLFGWSAAFIFEVVSKVYKSEGNKI